jgi:hypothetical protein
MVITFLWGFRENAARFLLHYIIQNIDGKNYKKLPDDGWNLQEPLNKSLHALAGSFPAHAASDVELCISDR